MNVKEAVKIAKDYVRDIFIDEDIADIGLEEVEASDDGAVWHVTVGFRRGWDKPTEQKGGVGTLFRSYEYINRWYKVVEIRDGDGKVLAMRDRELQSAA